MFSLIPVLLIIYIFPIGCSSFDRRCPYPSEWKIRESIVCTSHLEKSYYCLFDDNNKHFTELCRDGPTTAARGYKIEYSGGFEITKCSDARYQPFGFDTEGNSDCIYIKAFCQDEGLVAVEHGDPKTDDQQCACNYTKGYGFVKMPVNKCYCIPSQEDCTCYKQMCNESSTLSLDDTCATPYGFNYTQICTSTGITNQKEISLSITTVIDDNTFKASSITKHKVTCKIYGRKT